MRAGLLVLVACAALGQTKEQAWQVLEAGVNEKNAEKRAGAVRALAIVPEEDRAVGMAESALADKDSGVRKAGAAALGDMLSIGSIPKLQAALKDKNPEVVLAAARALDKVRDKSAYEVYYAVLVGNMKGENIEAAATSAVAGQIKKMRDPKVLADTVIPYVPVIGNGYGAAKRLRRSDPSPARAAAALGLANDPDPRSAEALALAASDPSAAVRAASLTALARRGDPVMLKDVELAMKDEEVEVRCAAAAAWLHLDVVKEARTAGAASRGPRRGETQKRGE